MAKRCKFGVSKSTGKCLKKRRAKKATRRKRKCKFGVNKNTGACLKTKRAKRR